MKPFSGRKFALTLLLLVGVVGVVGAVGIHASSANALQGADDAGFLNLVDTWLGDNDPGSLPVLSRLSREGNSAARLLLSRIEITDRASGAFIRQLSRPERLDLYRSNRGNGVFRSSWIKVEADRGNPLAQVLFEGTAPGINLAAIERLYDAGEFEATEHLVRKIAVDGSQAERAKLAQLLIPMSELTPYLRGFRFSRQGMTTGRTALQHMIGTIEGIDPVSVELDSDPETEAATKFIDLGYQAGAQTIGDLDTNRHDQTIVKWVTTAPPARPLANLCRRACSGRQVSACAITGFGLVGGYYELIRFDSPLESIIPQDRFLGSKRAIGMMLRRIAAARTEAGVQVFSESELEQESPCLAAAVRGRDYSLDAG